MDSRCLRKLKQLPNDFCPLAVMRLRWIESLGHEPTEEEERSAPGCQWYSRNPHASFCFFKMMSNNPEPLTDSQVAHYLCLSEKTIKKTKEEALNAIKEDFQEIKDAYGDEVIIPERQVDPYEDQLNDYTGVSSIMLQDEPELPADKEAL